MFSKNQIDAWNCKMNTIDKDDKGEAKMHPKECFKERKRT